MIGKTLSTLLVIGGLVAVYFIYQDFWRDELKRRNPWVERLTPLIRPHLARHVGTPEAEAATEANFLTIVFTAWRAGEEGHEMTETVKNAATAAGAKDGEAARISAAIAENVKNAKSFEVFSNPNNVMSLERGEPPICGAKGWEDELVVVGHQLSPVLAPEAAFAIPNLRLVPESVRDMETDQITIQVVDLARKWLSEGIVFPASLKEIEKRHKEQSR